MMAFLQKYWPNLLSIAIVALTPWGLWANHEMSPRGAVFASLLSVLTSIQHLFTARPEPRTEPPKPC